MLKHKKVSDILRGTVDFNLLTTNAPIGTLVVKRLMKFLLLHHTMN